MRRRIIAAYAVCAERFPQTFDPLQIETDAGSDHQPFIAAAVAIVEIERVRLRPEGSDRCRDQGHTARYQAARVAARCFEGILSCSNQRECRLVIVVCGGLDQCDIEPGRAPAQARGHGNAGAARADHEYLVFVTAHRRHPPDENAGSQVARCTRDRSDSSPGTWRAE